MKRRIQHTAYYLTGDPDAADHPFHYSVDIQEQLAKYHHYVQRGNPKVLPRLLKMIKKHPNIPAFRNYLSVYYAQMGNKKKAYEVNQKIVKRFPDYLLGKINLANQAIDLEKYEEVLEILGEGLDLQILYPERKVFHYNEFTPFMTIVMRYLLETEQYEAAESRIPLLEEALGEDHNLVIRMKENLGLSVNWEDQNDVTSFPTREYDESLKTTLAPSYTHQIVADLVDHTLEDAPELFPTLLALDRKSLIQDLATLLRDSLQRYHYWMEKNDSDDFYRDFQIQAILLLGELEAESELPLLLNILRQGGVFLHDWYGDLLAEEWWGFLYPIAKNQLPLLITFLQEPDIFPYSKAVVVTVVVQVALHNPDRKEEVVNHFVSLLSGLLKEQATDASSIDIDFCSMLVAEIIALHAPQLKKLSKEFYEAGMVKEWFIGNWSEIEADYQNQNYPEMEKQELPKSALETVQRLVEAWF